MGQGGGERGRDTVEVMGMPAGSYPLFFEPSCPLGLLGFESVKEQVHVQGDPLQRALQNYRRAFYFYFSS